MPPFYHALPPARHPASLSHPLFARCDLARGQRLIEPPRFDSPLRTLKILGKVDYLRNAYAPPPAGLAHTFYLEGYTDERDEFGSAVEALRLQTQREQGAGR